MTEKKKHKQQESVSPKGMEWIEVEEQAKLTSLKIEGRRETGVAAD